MEGEAKYLLDTNSLIQAFKGYYSNEICPGFWEFLTQGFESGTLLSIRKVYEELAGGGQNDWIAEWAKQHRRFFVGTEDIAVQEIVQRINGLEYLEKFDGAAYMSFCEVADPWLIAYAKATPGVTLVTLETNRKQKQKIKIPPICKELDVRFIDTFEMLKELKAVFVQGSRSPFFQVAPVQQSLPLL